MARKLKKETVSKMPVSKLVMTWILCLSMAVFPWIVSVKQVSEEWGITGASADIVLFCKEIAVIIFAVAMTIWLLVECLFLKRASKWQGAYRLDRGYWFLIAIIVVTTILSAIFSENKLVAMLGSSTEFEGMLAILSYLMIFYVAYSCMRYEKAIKIFNICMTGLIVLVIVFSLVEFLYKPFLMWTPVEKLANFFVSFQGLNFVSNDDFNRVVLTFYTSNYYGGFCCLLYPFVYEMWIKAEVRYARILTMILNVGMIFCVVVSKSSCALYIWFMEVVILSILEWRRIKKKWMDLLILIIVTVISFIVINQLSGGTFVELGKVIIKNDDTYTEEETDKFIINDISLEGSTLVLLGETADLKLVYNDGFRFYNEKDELLKFKTDDEGWKRLSNEKFKMIKVYFEEKNKETGIRRIIVELGYKEGLDFYLYNGEFYGVSPDGTLTKNIYGGTKGHEWLYKYFTGRGYAWVNSLPLLKETLLLGKGPGNFFYYFKQYDYVGLLKTHGSYKMLIDKPHNSFLQYGINIGVVGTVAMFSLFVGVIVSGLRDLKNANDSVRYICVAVIVSLMAFGVYSMFNDSIVTVTPYSWLLVGVAKGVHTEWLCKINKNVIEK